jgi:chromosome segregation ATPase
MSSDENQKFGLAGNEQAQGYEPMPMALPVEPTTALDVTEDMGTDHPTYKHLTRPDEGEPVDRSYKDVRSGEEIDPKFSVSQAQAASDLARVRAEERQAREAQGNRDLADALDQLNARDQGQQPAQQSPEAPQPELDGIQPEAMDPDAARADADAKWAEADKAIESLLQEPYARERIEQSFNHVKEAAKQETERAHALASAAQQHYATATQNLLNEASGVIGALYPSCRV